MNNFKNLKIAITDETHLKAVCEVLESMGYKLDYESSIANYVVTCSAGIYQIYSCAKYIALAECSLTDLLKTRDEMVKANAKSS